MIHKTFLHRIFSDLKSVLPAWLSNFIRGLATAVIGPLRFAFLSGFVRSSFKRSAVAKDGSPIPWYTYPLIDFLKFRDFSNKSVLEFGGGQSTLWWAERSKEVTTLEGDQQWFETIKGSMPPNVDLRYVTMSSMQDNVDAVTKALDNKGHENYDIIVIDGLYRTQLIEIALASRAPDGIIICDNADGYGIAEGFRDSGLQRVDFFGYAPGVVLPECSCIYFGEGADVFSANYEIPEVYKHP